MGPRMMHSNLFVMSDIQRLTVLLQQLFLTQAQQAGGSQKDSTAIDLRVISVVESVLADSNAEESTGPVQTIMQIKHATLFCPRQSFVHSVSVVQNAQAVGDWGSADAPEELLDACHPRGKAACDFQRRKCGHVLKQKISLENSKSAVEL